MRSEWECIDLNCTNYDGDRYTLGFCEPDIFDTNIPLRDNKTNVTIHDKTQYVTKLLELTSNDDE